VSAVELAQWITGEDKRSFFQFEVEVAQSRPLWLKISGDEGIKKFIRVTIPAAQL